ncbi:MAG: YbaB/EbfC family nucleoid-associated protein [Salinispira sp.]
MNPMDLFKNFENIQGKLKDYQEQISSIQVTGSAGGDMVKIVLAGNMSIVDVHINKDAIDINDVETLQDLVKAAHSNAMALLKEQLSAQVGNMGLNIPPGFMN